MDGVGRVLGRVLLLVLALVMIPALLVTGLAGLLWQLGRPWDGVCGCVRCMHKRRIRLTR